MTDSHFVNHGDKRIYYIDFTNSDVDSIKQTVAKSKKDIAAQPEGPVFTMTNVEGVGMTPAQQPDEGVHQP